MYNLAAPGTGFAIVGAMGASGLAFVMTLYSVAGTLGKRKIKFNQDAAMTAGFVTGQAYAMAGEFWSFAAQVSGGLSQAVQSSITQGGFAGAGAIALALCVIARGFKLGSWAALFLGLIAPPLFTAAGGGFAVVTHILTNLLTQATGG